MLLNFCLVFLFFGKEKKCLVTAQLLQGEGKGLRVGVSLRAEFIQPLAMLWRWTDSFKVLRQGGFKSTVTFLFRLYSRAGSTVPVSSLLHHDFLLSGVPLATFTAQHLLKGGGIEIGLRQWLRRSVNAHYLAIIFLSEKFIGLFLSRIKMFPYQNSHFKAATSRCSWHQNDCVKAVCQQIDCNKTSCIEMAVSCNGTGLAIKGTLFWMSVLFIVR